jgi:uncharacterized membrane protein (DUF485 family)
MIDKLESGSPEIASRIARASPSAKYPGAQLTTVVSPERPQPNFGGLDRTTPPPPTEIDFLAIQRSDEFVALRRRLRRFVFPISALFFGWYLCYVLLAAYAHEFMSRRLTGEITVGLVMGVLQFGTTILIMVGYQRYARRWIDPQVEAVRARADLMRGPRP